MNEETEDEFVRFTKSKWSEWGLPDGTFNELRCREIYQSTRPSKEIWSKKDDAKFDKLAEREVSQNLNLHEMQELEELNQKRNETLADVPAEDLAREQFKSLALTTLSMKAACQIKPKPEFTSDAVQLDLL